MGKTLRDNTINSHLPTYTSFKRRTPVFNLNCRFPGIQFLTHIVIFTYLVLYFLFSPLLVLYTKSGIHIWHSNHMHSCALKKKIIHKEFRKTEYNKRFGIQKEILINGILYDILEYKYNQDKIILSLLQDEDISDCLLSLQKFLTHLSDSLNSLFSFEYLLPDNCLSFLNVQTNHTYIVIHFLFLPKLIKHVLTPPPKTILTSFIF